MQYCSDGDLTRHLPDNLPDGFNTDVYRLPYITRASQKAQEKLIVAIPMGSFGGATQMFPDVDDSPATPESVREIVARMAAIAILGKMGIVVSALINVADLQDDVDAQVADIREGRTVVMDSAGTTYVRGSIETNVEGTKPVFTMGRKDADGELVGDEGTTDGYVG